MPATPTYSLRQGVSLCMKSIGILLGITTMTCAANIRNFLTLFVPCSSTVSLHYHINDVSYQHPRYLLAKYPARQRMATSFFLFSRRNRQIVRCNFERSSRPSYRIKAFGETDRCWDRSSTSYITGIKRRRRRNVINDLHRK